MMDSSNHLDPTDGNSKADKSDADGGEQSELFPGFKDVDSFVKYGFGAVLSATRAVADLPEAGDEFEFYGTYPGFQEFCQSQGDKLFHCMKQIMEYHGCRSTIKGGDEFTEMEKKFDLVVDTNEAILEKVGIQLDEAEGLKRSTPILPAGCQVPKIVVSSWNRQENTETAPMVIFKRKTLPKETLPAGVIIKANEKGWMDEEMMKEWLGHSLPGSAHSNRSETFRLLQAKNIVRPQLKFKEKIDNTNTPFIPKIFIKPNALKSLPSYFTDKQIRKERPEDLDVPAALADFIHQQRTQEHVEDMFAHPYQYELEHLVIPENLLTKPEPQMYKPMAETKCSFIESLDDLVALNEKLGKLSEFAVDLENHSYRSFLGFTCLMQVSTREEDFLIDTLELRSEMYILNEVFTDPTIVKVFHGADSDIEWLQRDFGLYIVNLFDTHQASRALNLARHSLDHLLNYFCNVESDKRYQLADWRIRPLPEEMVQYARSDTHYLLYIYDCLRAKLIDCNHGRTNLLQSVWNQSKTVSLRKYNKPIFTEELYLDALKKQKRVFNTKQLTAFRLLFAWRDNMARQEDESTGYVLPTHMLCKISEELPRVSQGILACCNPAPPLVKQNANELHLLVQEAIEMPLLKPEISVPQKKAPLPIKKQECLLFGPHDFSKMSKSNVPQVISDDVPVKQGTLSSEDSDKTDPEKNKIGVKSLSEIILFKELETGNVKESDAAGQLKARQIHESFENPFKLYLPNPGVHVNKFAQFDPSSKIFEISRRWKLMTPDQQKQNLEAKKKAKAEEKLQAKKAAEERIKAKQSYQESLKNVETVRQQAAESSKGAAKKRDRDDIGVGQVAPKPKKKPKKSAETPQTTEEPSEDTFEPFDYSQSDPKVFTGANSKNNQQFDPNRQARNTKKKKGIYGQKNNFASGNKSMSYLAGKSDRGFRHNWPKR